MFDFNDLSPKPNKSALLCVFNKSSNSSKSVADLPHLLIAALNSPIRYLLHFAGVDIWGYLGAIDSLLISLKCFR